ncbi:hypothetical protein, partial [Alkalibacillus haloalkaliphilus]|uniref:hypothetical protein n=1 Tax=Alkalibacillus haloalkaliphilus TaxID=94136 RepID=UPI002936CE8E
MSDQEKEHARIVLTDMEASFTRLDREISRLSAEREKLGKGISKFHSAHAPRKRLPAEVHAQIFVYAVGTKP